MEPAGLCGHPDGRQKNLMRHQVHCDFLCNIYVVKQAEASVLVAHNSLSICLLLSSTGSHQEWFSRDCVEAMTLAKLLQDVNQSTGVKQYHIYTPLCYTFYLSCIRA